MVQEASDNYTWRCEKYAFDLSYCVHVCTEEPTVDPTINPIVSTYYPTQASKETQTGSTRTLENFGVHVWIIGALVGTGLLGLLLCLGCKCYKKKHGDQVVPSTVPVSPNRMASHSVSRDKDNDNDEQMQPVVERQQTRNAEALVMEAMKQDKIVTGLVKTRKKSSVSLVDDVEVDDEGVTPYRD